MPPDTSSSAAETEEMYVEYRVMHVQGGGDNAQQAGVEPRASVDGSVLPCCEYLEAVNCVSSIRFIFAHSN